MKLTQVEAALIAHRTKRRKIECPHCHGKGTTVEKVRGYQMSMDEAWDETRECYECKRKGEVLRYPLKCQEREEEALKKLQKLLVAKEEALNKVKVIESKINRFTWPRPDQDRKEEIEKKKRKKYEELRKEFS